jgi:uncharacterized protein (TIRG00374 family)
VKKLIQWAVSLLLIGILLALVDLGEVARVFRAADPVLLGVGVAITVADRLLMAGKWLPLLRVQQPGVGTARAVKAYFASSFAALVLPASVGGDMLRAYGIGTGEDAVMEVGASVVFERVLGVVASGVVALLILWIAVRSDLPMAFLFPWAVGCAAVGIAAAIVPASRTARRALKRLLGVFGDSRWVGLVERFAAAYGVYRAHTRTLVIVGVLSVVEQLFPGGVFWAVARALQLPVPLEALFVAVPLSMFAARMPVAVAGIGILEGGLVYLLGLYDVPASEAISLALAGRLVEFVAVLPGALWWQELRGRSPEPEVRDPG